MWEPLSAVLREAGELGERAALPRAVQASGSGQQAREEKRMLEYRGAVAGAFGLSSSQAAPAG